MAYAKQTFTGIGGTFTAPAGVFNVRVIATQNLQPYPGPTGTGAYSNGLISTDNNTYMWGLNTSGQIGNNAFVSQSTPVLVTGGYNFKQLSIGGADGEANDSGFVTAIDFSGNLYNWGYNGQGQIGNASILAVSSPVLVSTNSGVPTRWLNVQAGSQYALGLDVYGRIFAWGINTAGCLGNAAILAQSSPVLVAGTGLPSFKQIIATIGEGTQYSLGLSTGGAAYAWGYNANGQLGNNSILTQSSPVLVSGGNVFTKLFTIPGIGTVFGLTAAGIAYAWGNGANGQLGNGTILSVSSPVIVSGNHSFSVISGANAAVAAIGLDGNVYSWGLSPYVASTNLSTPTLLVGAPVKTWLNIISVFGSNTQASILALASDGTLWGWGLNNSGQLGNNTIAVASSAIQVVGGYNFTQIFSIGGLSIVNTVGAIRSDGVMFMWGLNAFGILGNNAILAQSSPVIVAGSRPVQLYTAQGIFSIPVVPGTAYTVSIVTGPISFFGTTPIGTCISSVVVEFDQ